MTDRFRPLGDPAGFELIDPIQRHLEDRGWAPLIGPGSRWVDHLYENAHGRLRVMYSPSARSLQFAFQAGAVGAELHVTLPEDCRPVLDVVTRHQDALSVETWPAFIEEFLSASPAVLAITEDEDEDEDDIELTSVDVGASILREGEWIVLDDDD